MKRKIEKKQRSGKLRGILASHRRSVWILALTALLAAGIWVRDRADEGNSAGIVERGEEGQSAESRTFLFWLDTPETDLGDSDGAQAGTEKQELELEVAAVRRSSEEIAELLEEAVAGWEAEYLGENASANEVRQDLVFPVSACDGLVAVSYESGEPGILAEDGTVVTDELGEEGELVQFSVRFSYDDVTQIETYTVLVLPPEEGSAEWMARELAKAARQAEEESREAAVFALPDSVAGYRVIWVAEENRQWLFVLLIGVTAAVCLERKEKQDEKARQKRRREQLAFEYPQMVDRFAVLLDSGMTIRRAWERILAGERQGARGRGGVRPGECAFLEEMRITYREIREGRGEREAYERFGSRIGLMPYRRFSTILAQNLSRGTRDIRELLQRESEDAPEMRRNRARKMGEEAGSKLLFPMLVMLVLVLVVLLLPALTGM
ncbi:MAG: type II secretion system F family protein [Clostridiales bacterium]|nr:type II secretion system F family protein [Clostridiales bacterium]